MLCQSLLVCTFRPTCVLDKCTLEYKLVVHMYSCVYIRTCTKFSTKFSSRLVASSEGTAQRAQRRSATAVRLYSTIGK
jgi:hypothetical protein